MKFRKSQRYHCRSLLIPASAFKCPATSLKKSDKRDIYFLFIYLNVRTLNRTDPDKPDNLQSVRLCPDMSEYASGQLHS
jgi:hypothetical protein